MVDYIGLATLITSGTASVATIVQLFRGHARDIKLAGIHDLVNGQSEKLNTVIAKGSFAEG